MKNVTTFKTSLALKAAGFPQPQPEAGQVWYKEGRGIIILNSSDSITYAHIDTHVRMSGILVQKIAAFFIEAPLFAPGPADLLRWMSDEDFIRIWKSHPYEARELFTNPESLAGAWLEKHSQNAMQ